ncbi:hypothetical protein Pint_34809 [Pistacia integerrima]|uniref:Uncharacterized protein n=1 Tax=Pistacia integerrima TaxID=434235 RepID=A0ACC0X2K5_9ROSI|nr:hypothetical protein Pint_34809 [Pistacia integerrima]
MEVMCRVSKLAWAHSISPSLHIPQNLSRRESKRFRVWCANADQTQKMTVSVTGATGFIGKRLVERLQADNHQVRVLTRSRSKAQLIFPGKKVMNTFNFLHKFDQKELIMKLNLLNFSFNKATRVFPGLVIAEEPEWKDCIQGSTAVVNLAGMPISTRWSLEIKKEIKGSRVRVTSKVVELINGSPEGVRPSVLVSATAVGYYGTSETQVFDEGSPSGNDYLAEGTANGGVTLEKKVCREWEGTALKVNKDVRLALIRIGVVLGKDGGALAKMIPLFMMFAGGPLGSGKQW